jgi:two-component system phosphate regulon response regulator PhoB
MQIERPILVVEDDDALRTLLAMVVQDELGARVVEARNGREALERMRQARPALVLLDLRMPMLDGVELCRRVKSDPETRGIPVLAISAGARADQEIAADCDDFLFTPFDYDDLVGKLRRCLSRAA